jgi:hypothetical protein
MKSRDLTAIAALVAPAIFSVQFFALTRGRAASEPSKPWQIPPATVRERARMSAPLALFAQGRGNPSMNLQDGHKLLTDYTGTNVTQADSWRYWRPLALLAGDFDEDGVPDPISGYGCASCSTNSTRVSDASGYLP